MLQLLPWKAVISKGHLLYSEENAPIKSKELLPYDLLIPSRESRKGEISISALIRDRNVCVRQVDHPDAHASYVLIWKKNHTLSHVAEEFIYEINSR